MSWPLVTGEGIGEPLHPSVPAGRRPAAWMEPVTAVVPAVVVGPDVFDVPDDAAAAMCRALAVTTGCALLEVTLARRADDGTWVVVDANPMPSAVPPAAVTALVAALAGRRAPVGSVS